MSRVLLSLTLLAVVVQANFELNLEASATALSDCHTILDPTIIVVSIVLTANSLTSLVILKG